MNLQPVLRRQVFGRQRRPKALAHRSAVLFPHLPQHLLSQLLVVGAIRASPRVAMLQPRSSFLPIPLPQPLGLTRSSPLASTTRSCLLRTRASTSTRPTSLLLICVRPNLTASRKSY